MSKIAEKRTNEIIGEFHDGDYTDHSRHNTQWVAFKQGYDQAIQDFLEKACEYLTPINHTHPHLIDLDDFKKYMQDEM